MRMFSSYALTTNERNSHSCGRSLEEVHIRDRDDLVIRPIVIRKGKRWLCESLGEVRRNINLINM